MAPDYQEDGMAMRLYYARKAKLEDKYTIQVDKDGYRILLNALLACSVGMDLALEIEMDMEPDEA